MKVPAAPSDSPSSEGGKGAVAASSSNDHDAGDDEAVSASQAAWDDGYIEADLEMPDGSKIHLARKVGVVAVSNLDYVQVFSDQADQELGIGLRVQPEKVTVDAPATVSAEGGTLVSLRYFVVGGEKVPRLMVQGGQVTYSALGGAVGSKIDATFTDLVATQPGSAEVVVKVTNGVLHVVVGSQYR